MKGLVYNIQRFSIHDGPGIRTTVFLKGCNLKCFWCHNPESMKARTEVQLFPQKCIGCGKCFQVCPVNAHQVKDGERVFLRELCRGCGTCTDTCYAEALVLTGKEMTVDEVLEEVEKDKPFYENSGGGVTFSGGEPLLQRDFVKALLVESKRRGFHTAVDTAGNVAWEVFEEILPYVDLFLYDLKGMDGEAHEEATGDRGERIKANTEKLAAKGARIWIRIPVIPGFNDSIETVEKMAKFVEGLKTVEMVELLPFHGLGEGKYESLGLVYSAKGLKPPSDEYMERLVEVFRARNLPAKRG